MSPHENELNGFYFLKIKSKQNNDVNVTYMSEHCVSYRKTQTEKLEPCLSIKSCRPVECAIVWFVELLSASK